jgi:hypothetical protein
MLTNDRFPTWRPALEIVETRKLRQKTLIVM